MEDVQGMTPEQRREAADALCAQVRAWMEDPRNTFRVSVARGMEARANRATGSAEPLPNGSLTLRLEINGGASGSVGPDVLPFPAPIARPGGDAQ
ncbi:MAG: hypothetical protein AB1941_02115 [Gemmatimonadota bacterium]